MIFNQHRYSLLNDELKYASNTCILVDRIWRYAFVLLLVTVCFGAGLTGYFAAQYGSDAFSRQPELGYLPCKINLHIHLAANPRIYRSRS